MHEQLYGHFGLQQTPFHVSPSPKNFVFTSAHDEALRQLMFGIRSRKGLMLLTGEPGTGKTTIVQYLLEVLKRDGYSTAYVFHPLLSFAGVLRVILTDFGVACSSNEKGELLAALRKWLINRRRILDCPVIVIDEAQALTDQTLDELRMLLNLEVTGESLVQLVLAGQPQLETRLGRPSLKQLRQRIMCHARLSPLSFDETVGYIRKRLVGAGASRPDLFSNESLEAIYQHSKGNPRVIHLLCERSLLSAYAAGRSLVSGTDISSIAQEFGVSGAADHAADLCRLDALSKLIPSPKLETETTVSRQKARNDLPVDSAEAPMAGVPKRTLATEPQQSPAEVSPYGKNARVRFADEDELPLSLSRAALLVASQKVSALDKRLKEAVRRVLEAGRSVLWLGREQELSVGLQSPPAAAMVADLARRGRETLNRMFPPAELAVTGEAPARKQQVYRSLKPRPLSLATPAEPSSKAFHSPTVATTPMRTARTGKGGVQTGFGTRGAFRQYWQGVGASLRRDIRQFLDRSTLGRSGAEAKRGPPY